MQSPWAGKVWPQLGTLCFGSPFVASPAGTLEPHGQQRDPWMQFPAGFPLVVLVSVLGPRGPFQHGQWVMASPWASHVTWVTLVFRCLFISGLEDLPVFWEVSSALKGHAYCARCLQPVVRHVSGVSEWPWEPARGARWLSLSLGGVPKSCFPTSV